MGVTRLYRQVHPLSDHHFQGPTEIVLTVKPMRMDGAYFSIEEPVWLLVAVGRVGEEWEPDALEG